MKIGIVGTGAVGGFLGVKFSLAGNDVVDQAIQFEKVVGIDAAILTKLDADAKGGAALSIAHAVGKPILFISVGQRYGDLVPFNPEWMVNRLFE